jgi:hypothetical protein
MAAAFSLKPLTFSARAFRANLINAKKREPRNDTKPHEIILVCFRVASWFRLRRKSSFQTLNPKAIISNKPDPA